MTNRKIVNLSLHRSSTESFSQFMRDHGFRSVHWPGPEFDLLCEPAVAELDTRQVFERARPIIEANDVFADVPYCFLIREFLKFYPDARFLMIIRDVHSWIRSARRHIGTRELDNLEKLQYWLNSSIKEVFLHRYNDEQLSAIYLKHLMNVINMMQTARAEFRIFWLDENSLDQKDLITALGKHLEFEVRKPYPAINVAAHRLLASKVGTPPLDDIGARGDAC
jgi:hypothetical protein